MRKAARTIAFFLGELLNGVAVVGLIYCVTTDVSVARWLIQ